MHRRCKNPSDDSYLNYGGRGIKVCDRWSEFEKFAADMGPCPPGLSLDRIDNDKGYAPENCRWATMREQLNNQRRNVRIAINGQTKTLSEWASGAGLNYDLVQHRYARGVRGTDLLAQRLNGPRTADHGTRRGYETLECRCDACKSFNAERARLAHHARRMREGTHGAKA